MTLSVAVIPALLVSLYLPRAVVLDHHLVVLAMCILATSGPGVPVPLRVAAVLTATATIVGSSEVMYRLRNRHDVIAASLHGWSVTDPLTGLANRRGLELAFAQFDPGRSLRVFELDVDDFKSINDRLGHGTGDDALARLALTLTLVTPPGSVVGRTGGDEFVIVSPGHDDGAAERIRGAAALLPVPLSVTVASVQSAPGIGLRPLGPGCAGRHAADRAANSAQRRRGELARGPSGSTSRETVSTTGAARDRREPRQSPWTVRQAWSADHQPVGRGSSSTSTTTVSPSRIRPASSSFASRSPIALWISRRSGRAP